MNPQCSLKLKPPKIPKSGKKLYREFFLRTLKDFTVIYWIKDGLYIVSVPQPRDARLWIDKNYNKITTRTWDDGVYDRNTNTNGSKKEQQSFIFS